MPPKAKKPMMVIVEPSAYNTYFEVRESKAKGRALYTKLPLGRNTRIHYQGKRIDQKEYNRLLTLDKKDPAKQYMAYIIAGGRKGSYIDAHPRYAGGKRWLAAAVNEPDVGVTANMVMTGGINPALVTVRDIKVGEQLTVCYGSSYVRKGYKKGRCPRRPNWL